MLVAFVILGIVVVVLAILVWYLGPETFLAKVFGTKHARDVKAMMPLVAAINALEPEMHELSNQERYESYRCDITYGTNNEYGFDYLRDNMKFRLSDCVQREHFFAIVDEVDSILIDEARTPLIISGPSEESTDKYYRINR